jgi:hypothetical protein
MKNFPLIQKTLLAAIAVTGMNMFSSCESCSRKDDDMQDDDVATTRVDTVYIDTCMTPNDTLMRDGANGGAYIPRGGKNNATGTGAGTSTGNGTAAQGSGKNTLSEDEITDRVENSSSKATKNGKPVISGGNAGSGQGTGTGSTGNNSRVTTKEDQLRN